MSRRRKLLSWALARRLTALAFAGVLVLGSFSWFPWFKGAPAAGTWFGIVPLVDPLAALESTLAGRSFQSTVWIGAGLLVATALLLGPVFCGWICPLGLLLDLNQWVRRKLLRRAARPGLRVPRPVRYGMLGLVVGVAVVGRIPLFQTLSPINIVGWSLIFGVAPALLVVAGIALVEWLAPRLWCRSLCPLGALYSLLGRFAPFRVRIHPDESRRPCFQCSTACPMGIAVIEEYSLAGKLSVDDPDCTRCGDCIDVCPTSTLKLSFKRY